MTTSAYMPDVKVEIAFNAGYLTPAASRTWVDVSQWLELREGMSITYGRTDELGNAEPNRLELVLDNSDGRFTARRAGSPYYPNVKVGRPIRVTSTPVGGAASVRFVGFIESWPLEWDGASSYAKAKISALSRMARLGLDAPIRSVVHEQYLAGDPLLYWPLGEAAGSVGATDLVQGVKLERNAFPGGEDAQFGFEIQLDGDEAATGLGAYANGGWLQNRNLTPPISTAGVTSVVLEFFLTDFGLSVVGSGQGLVLDDTSAGSGKFLWLSRLSDSYRLTYHDGTTQSTVTGGSVLGGEHHIAGVFARDALGDVTLSIYYDGVLSGTLAVPAANAVAISADDVFVAYAGTDGEVWAHAAVGANPATIPDRASAGLTGFAGESSGEWIERLATYAKVDPAELSVPTDGAPVQAIQTTGMTALAAMRKVEETEDGVLYDSRTGVLTFKSRQARFGTASVLTLSATDHEIGAGISPRLDRSTLTNDATGTGLTGTAVRVTDDTSIAEYGYARKQFDIASTEAAAYNVAAWAVARYAEPNTRIPSLPVDVMPFSTADKALLFSLDIGSRITIDALPSQAPVATQDFFVEGYVETIGPESYDLVFNVSPVDAAYSSTFWVLGDATYGQYDVHPIGY